MEHIATKYTMNHLEQSSLLYDIHHKFLQPRSCETYVDYFYENLFCFYLYKICLFTEPVLYLHPRTPFKMCSVSTLYMNLIQNLFCIYTVDDLYAVCC